jgi:transcription initiation factor TFIIH subunit 3
MSSLLALLVDATSAGWTDRDDALSLDNAMRNAVALLRAHVALSPRNAVVLALTTDLGLRVLYAPPSDINSNSTSSSTSMVQIEAAINEKWAQLSADVGPGASGSLAASLSHLLCIVNRFLHASNNAAAAVRSDAASAANSKCARILLLHSSPDDPAQYISTMNAIFCAQKLSVPIDACVLRADDVACLQQAASITGGVYLRPPLNTLQHALIQALLLHFLPDAATRALLNMPQQTVVDMRASCVCHGNMLDIGFVCSVCLSIFCARSPICATCNARFELPGVEAPQSTAVADQR